MASLSHFKTENPKRSQHGTNIALDQSYPDLVGIPLEINGQTCGSGGLANPNRYKQHGFHFNASNCIACHACESACSEKNDLPSHLAYRHVGTIEGGSYPDVTRINISMACNHCEDPVCLKGCPTRAYTKYLEYGAVLQDPEICFGCGYCTWVCPYNAPQLDTQKGHVQKCNMCIDRLEVGLKPACVDACLGNALDFGVIDETPKKQQEIKLTIPSFTDPSISRPNIRFQLKETLPDTFHRIDDVPITYQREEHSPSEGVPTNEITENGLNSCAPPRYKIKEKSNGNAPGWNLAALRSREDPLVLFTLISQFAVGAFLLLFFLPKLSASADGLLSMKNHPVAMGLSLFSIVSLQTFALVLSTLHLGKPQYFYRAMNNLRHSWVSREIATMGGFYGFLAAYSVVTVFPRTAAWLPEGISALLPSFLGTAASIFGPLALYCMYRCYRIPARPFWDHWHSGGAFFSSAFILGSSAIGLIFGTSGLSANGTIAVPLQVFALVLLAGLFIQGTALYAHGRYLTRRGEEAAISRMLMMEKHGLIYRARWFSWGVLMIGGVIFTLSSAAAGPVGMIIWGLIFAAAVLHEVIGRALFYVLVTPTTVPRGFFWGNHSFETMARKSGLAARPQVGVLVDGH